MDLPYASRNSAETKRRRWQRSRGAVTHITSSRIRVDRYRQNVARRPETAASLGKIWGFVTSHLEVRPFRPRTFRTMSVSRAASRPESRSGRADLQVRVQAVYFFLRVGFSRRHTQTVASSDSKVFRHLQRRAAYAANNGRAVAAGEGIVHLPRAGWAIKDRMRFTV